MLEYKRSQRVAELLREEISKIVTNELKDPDIGLATITHVRVSDNLRSAHIFVQVYGDVEKSQKSLSGLLRARNWIRNELGHRLSLKYVPELTFCYDDTLEYAENIESLIKTIHEGDADG
ncbi:MAG: 30S ribosome-binding factor RbfA [bacterium]